MEFIFHGQRHRAVNTHIEPQLERVLSFLGMDLSIFGVEQKTA